MNTASHTQLKEQHIRTLLERWATTTRRGEVLVNHSPNVLIYDVLPPMKYEGAEAYRKSWGDWQPETQSEGQFELQDLVIHAGSTVAFAHGLIKCGGVLPSGKKFEDLVRVRSASLRTRHSGRCTPAHFQAICASGRSCLIMKSQPAAQR